MKTYKVAVLPGDGIGPEVMREAEKVLEAVAQKYGVVFEKKEALVGGAALDEYGHALPEETLEICQWGDAILFSAVGGPKWENLPPQQQPERVALLGLRKHFSLFANLRLSLVYKELASKSILRKEVVKDGFDVLVVRELTGGIYFGEPSFLKEDSQGKKIAVDTMVYKEDEIRRIAKVAYDLAMKRNQKVTLVDKANVLDCGVLWREVVKEIAADYPKIETNYLYVDNAAMQLVMNPKQFDVILTGNMFGDILSDLSSVFAGSLGLVPSASLGEGSFGMYEPAGGSAPDIAGRGIANPIAQIMSAAMMLQYSFGMTKAAEDINNGIQDVLCAGYRTIDIYEEEDPKQKKIGTEKFGDLLVEAILKK